MMVGKGHNPAITLIQLSELFNLPRLLFIMYIYIYIHTYAFILMKRIYDRPQRQLEKQNPPKDSRSGILFCYPLGHRHSTYNMCIYIYIR